jgi:hypothetical protein
VENKLFVCDCGSLEHQFVINYDPDPGWNDHIYVNIHLSKKKFWNRVQYAVKYILGHQCDYGAFQEILLDKKTTEKLAAVLSTHAKTMK